MKNIFISILAVLSLCSALYAEPLLNNDLGEFKTEIGKSIKNSINEKEKKQATELIFAAVDGNLDTVKSLWEQGVNLDSTDDFGDTALIKASGGGHREVVDFLISKGANPDIQGLIGNTALMNAVTLEYVDIVKILAPVSNLSKKNDIDKTALKMAKETGNKEIIHIIRKAIKQHFKDALSGITKEYVKGVSGSNGQIDK